MTGCHTRKVGEKSVSGKDLVERMNPGEVKIQQMFDECRVLWYSEPVSHVLVGDSPTMIAFVVRFVILKQRCGVVFWRILSRLPRVRKTCAMRERKLKRLWTERGW